jgi:hypothetical protein
MSVNVYGLSGNKSKSNVTKKDLDSKFINLTKNIQLKVDKNGDALSGNLSMEDHKITYLGDPVDDRDATNKTFVMSEIKANSIVTKVYIDTLLHSKLDKIITKDLNMNGQKVVGLANPTNDNEACNKKYLDSKIKEESYLAKLSTDGLIKNTENRLNLCVQKDELTTENTFDVAAVINNLLKEKGVNQDQFFKAFNFIEKMYEKYMEIFEIQTSEALPDVIKSCVFFTDLKVAIITVIEELPRKIFVELKAKLMKENLISTPEPGEKSLRRKYRRFINGFSKIVDPNRSNEALELLIQKNLLLIDIGYVYFIESLIKMLIDHL